MIIINGTYSYLANLPGEEQTDEDGNPVADTEQWSVPSPCNIQTVTDTSKGVYDGGNFRQASFHVLVDPQPFPHRRLQLTRLGEPLGIYDVISVEPLQAVGMVKVTVAK